MVWGMKNYTIQLFGSSIVEGRIGAEHAADRWYELMRKELCEMFPATCFAVYNCAVGGESIRELMAHFDRDLAGHTPDLCIAMFGWNNCRMCYTPDLRVSIAEFRELLTEFPFHLPEKTRCVGVIPQPMIDEWHRSGHDPAYAEVRARYGGNNAYHDLEREAGREFFRSHGIPFIDLDAAMAADPKKYILPDGIHLNPEGHRLFAAEMLKALGPLLRADGCC